MWPFSKRKKKMGGENESMLKADKKASAASPSMGGTPPGNVLRPDAPPAPANTVEAIQPTFRTQQGLAVPMQTQAIRTHMNAGQVHLHCDEQQLKAAVPVAEWYIIMRQLRSLAPFTWVDSENKCVAYFRPFINMGVFEVAIELAPVNIGARFNDMNAVTGKR